MSRSACGRPLRGGLSRQGRGGELRHGRSCPDLLPPGPHRPRHRRLRRARASISRGCCTRAGARVALAARRDGRAGGARGASSASAPLPVALDVTDAAAVGRAFDAAETAFGAPCDVVVNNAGIAVTRPALQHDRRGLGQGRSTSTCAAASSSRRRRRGAWSRRESRAASSTSPRSCGLRVLGGVAGYTASKAGAVADDARSSRWSWARHGIRVNAIAPGYVLTPINARLLRLRSWPGADQALAAAAPRQAGGPRPGRCCCSPPTPART